MSNEKENLGWVYRTDFNIEKHFMTVSGLEERAYNLIRVVSENVLMPSITLFRIIRLKQAYSLTKTHFALLNTVVIGSLTTRQMMK